MQKVCLVALAIMALLATMAVAETVQYQIAASRDDTFTIDSWNAYDQPTAFFPSSNGDRRAFFRWQLDIPAGATITSATMKVQSNGTAGNSSPSTVRLQVLDQEDCAAFISNPHFWVVGLDYVDWELPGTWTAGSWHSSPDISSLLQAFINRPGYASGNYFGIRGIHAAGLYKRAYQFDNAAEDGAILEVQYTTQSTPPPQQIVEYRINLGVDDAASIVTESGNSYTTAFFPGNNADRRAFMRWSVRIPTGATVDEVYLKVCGSGAYSDQNPSTIRIQMLDYDNCANFASNPFDRPVTASYVDWELPGVVAAGQWYTSPDLTALLQEFLDRPGNSYANFMGLRGMHVSGGYKKIYQYDYGDNTKGPILEVRYSGGLAMLELLMADPESRLGQKIYCRSINVYEGDRMEAYLDSTLVFSKDGNIQPEEMFTVDYSNLTAGAHNITVRILTNGVERGSLTRSWTTLHNGIPHVGINIDNAICIDGVPFFPITPFLLRKDNVVADPINTAINCLLGAGWYAEHTVTTWTDYLNVGSTNGFYVAGPLRWAGAVGSPVMDSDMQSLVNYVTSTRNHPALLAWSWEIGRAHV